MALKRREQLALIVCAVFVALFLMFNVVIKPLASARKTLSVSNEANMAIVGNMRQLADEVLAQRRSGGGSSRVNGNLTQVVDASARRNKLITSRLQPGNDNDLTVRLDNQDFDNVMRWLHQLEGEMNLSVKEFSVTPTNTVGLVNVSIKVQANG